MTVARALGVRLKTLCDITVPCGAPSEESDEASRAEWSVDNTGLFSLAAYEHCECDLSIYAFEPVAAICDVLRTNIERNTCVVSAGFRRSCASRSSILRSTGPSGPNP
jgi:hypothetical protein